MDRHYLYFFMLPREEVKVREPHKSKSESLNVPVCRDERSIGGEDAGTY